MDIGPQTMTVDAFLAWEARQDARYEFDGERAILMNGGTRAHGTLIGNLHALMHAALRGGPYRAIVASLKVRVGSRVRYPDVIVSDRAGLMSDTIEAEPLVLFEVLSAGSALTDRIVKLAEYRTLASQRRYVMVEHAAMAVTTITRSSEGGSEANWQQDVLVGADAVLRMPEIGAALQLFDLYGGVELAPLGDGDDEPPAPYPRAGAR